MCFVFLGLCSSACGVCELEERERDVVCEGNHLFYSEYVQRKVKYSLSTQEYALPRRSSIALVLAIYSFTLVVGVVHEV